jgi:hypothetical protein
MCNMALILSICEHFNLLDQPGLNLIENPIESRVSVQTINWVVRYELSKQILFM